jgi:hypothetical protein
MLKKQELCFSGHYSGWILGNYGRRVIRLINLKKNKGEGA